MEIFEADGGLPSPAEIRTLAERLNLTLDLYQPFRDLEGVTEDLFLDNLNRLEHKFQLMQELGMNMILVPSNVATATVHDDTVIADQLRRAGELAAQYNMFIAYEALAWGTYVNTYWHSWELVRAADHPNLGLCLDSFHILSRHDDPSHIEHIPAEKIFFVQLADAPELGMDLLPWSRHHRAFPGEGSFEMVEFMAHSDQCRLPGPLSLEFSTTCSAKNQPGHHRGRWPTILALDPTRRPRVGPQRNPARELLTNAKIGPVEVVDHVEISTDVPDDFGALLGALGFDFVGQHRRKSAQLFTAGDVRVVLTPSTSGGTYINSVAVTVDDEVLPTGSR